MVYRPKQIIAVVQKDATGCGIACVAALASSTYSEVKKIAMELGISVTDSRLWSDASDIRTLLKHFRIQADQQERQFQSWNTLPQLALLATKWHRKDNRAFWHWVIYWQSPNGPVVLDSNHSLQNNVRKDFGRIKPRWFISIGPKKSC